MNTASYELHHDDPRGSAVLGRITAHYSEFLRFIAARVGEPAAAEDILQSAYVKALERGSQLRDEESVVASFYRILRNAIVHHYRRGSARSKGHELFGAETPTSYEVELEKKICVCIGDVIGDLKTEYREAIEHVDLAGESVESFAQRQNTAAKQHLRASPPGKKSGRQTVGSGMRRLCGTQMP